MAQKSRNYCFTYNNYENTDTIINTLDNVGARYYTFGREVGESGTRHLQGFVIFKNARTLSGVIKAINIKEIHWEICKGTIEQNITYCQKDNDFVEWGDKPVGQGSRSDLLNITKDIKDGRTNLDLINLHGDKVLRILKHVDNVRHTIFEKTRNWKMDVRVYCGPPDCGKTRCVWEEFGVDNVYPKMPGKWWDHYRGQKCVLIDDFDPENCFGNTYDFYLKLMDRYPMFIEYKGGSCNFYSEVIIITSNFHPNDWFPNRLNSGAFFRRINEVRVFEKNGTWNSTQVGEVILCSPTNTDDYNNSFNTNYLFDTLYDQKA